jgi:hypothetical protein
MLTSSLLIERQPVPMCNLTFKVTKEKILIALPPHSKTAPNLGISCPSNCFFFQQTNKLSGNFSLKLNEGSWAIPVSSSRPNCEKERAEKV